MMLNADDVKALIDGMVKEAVENILVDLETMVQEEIVAQGLTGESSQLLMSVHTDVDKRTLYVNAPYAGYVEFGTSGMFETPDDPYAGSDLQGPPHSPGRKGPPPLIAIARWSRMKLTAKVKGRVKYPSMGSKKVLGLARAVQMHIYYHGTKPHPYLRNAIDRTRKKWDEGVIAIEVSE